MRNFKVVYTPKLSDSKKFRHRRFYISPNRLTFYIGSSNANTALSRALKSREDKCTVRFRKAGKIDFYVS